jgi:hypothetical protein
MYTALPLLLLDSLIALKKRENSARSLLYVPLYVLSQLQPLIERIAILYVLKYKHQQLSETLPAAACRSGPDCHGHFYEYENDRKPTIQYPCFTAGKSRVYI